MPAPLAKGLIFSISVLIAAGIAVYENPQVREWIDESRRKIAIALNDLSNELHPDSSSSERPQSSREDVSRREDAGPEAEARRREARAEIMRRRQMMHASRETGRAVPERRASQSFDELVDDKGQLRTESEGISKASATDLDKSENATLRQRQTEKTGFAAGVAMADPFSDEHGFNPSDAADSSLLDAPVVTEGSQRLPSLIPANSEPGASLTRHTAEQESIEPSKVTAQDSLSPLSAQATDLPTEQADVVSPSAATSFYSPPASVNEDATIAHDGQNITTFEEPTEDPEMAEIGDYQLSSRSSTPIMSPAMSANVSVIGSQDGATDDGLDVRSLATSDGADDGISTPSTWTEVGSVVSDQEL